MTTSIAWLDNSRIIAIYAVILLHVSSGIVINNDIGTLYWWVGNIYDSSVRWCVPVFVMISGALLLAPLKQENFIEFYKKRLSRILVPIIAWSIIFLIFEGIFNDSFPTIKDAIKKVVYGKPYYHMWFLFMIINLYLFTPFFRKIITISTKKELLFLIIIGFTISVLNVAHSSYISIDSVSDDPTLFINFFLYYIPYFFLGYFIRKDDKIYSKVLLWIIFLLSIVMTSLGYYFIAKWLELGSGLYFYDYLSITVIPMSISAMYILKAWSRPIFSKNITKNLTLLVLGVYLIHPIILKILKLTEYDALSFNPLVSVPITASIVFILSLFLSWVIYKIPYLRRII